MPTLTGTIRYRVEHNEIDSFSISTYCQIIWYSEGVRLFVLQFTARDVCECGKES